jgi:hypothetical protein
MIVNTTDSLCRLLDNGSISTITKPTFRLLLAALWQETDVGGRPSGRDKGLLYRIGLRQHRQHEEDGSGDYKHDTTSTLSIALLLSTTNSF